MLDTDVQVKSVLLDAAVTLADERGWTDGTLVNAAVFTHYYDRVAPQDLGGKDPLDLYASAVRHVQSAERRNPEQSLVRVYNPKAADHGWSSPHTAVDVVSDDMPFIVDSVLAVLEVRGLHAHVVVHPVFEVGRTTDGTIETLAPPTPGNDAAHQTESFLHLEIDRLADAADCADLENEIHDVLRDVRAAVDDWQPMRQQALVIAAELDTWAEEAASGHSRAEPSIGTDPAEVAALLRWMEAGWFIFVGYREYDLVNDDGPAVLRSRPATGLGVLRQHVATTRALDTLPQAAAARAPIPTVVNLTKANRLSTVHQAAPLDYVGVKEIDRDGRVTGERRFLGLFTSAVYSDRVEDIPVIRSKVAAVMERADFRNVGHDHARLLNTLQLYPRAELFQIEVEELESLALEILDLRDRRQASLLVRQDAFGRFLSCLVFLPRDRYSTDLRLAIESTLMDAYQGTAARYEAEVSALPLARLHIVIATDPAASADLPDRDVVRARLAQVIRTWDDFLYDALIDLHGEEVGRGLVNRYGPAFDPTYRANVLAEQAVHDITRLEAVVDERLDLWLHRPLDAPGDELRCKLYRSGSAITLSQFIPVLHDLGATVTDERPYEIHLGDGTARFIYDIGLRLGSELDEDARARFRDAVLAVWHGHAESDGLSQLVITAGLTWRDVSILRAYSRYLVQIGSPFSRGYVIKTLCRSPHIAHLLVQLFHARLAPAHHDVDNEVLDRAALLEAIDAVASLDADRILRTCLAVIDATVRTNHWQVGEEGTRRDALALKLDPRRVPDLPKPVPAAEIFVYSPHTEGVHLRAGRVARGGLRWSDRMEDYRTEVLGLMKAQTVKNSVIVPTGAKGGFVARQLPTTGTREEVMREVVRCYSTFVAALLDVTDNVVNGELVPPADVTRLDGDDPYLVVAADKGTATFSDLANSIATDRGFWLDDAFASGGSAGYDHKQLGITARGAWVSVERHFRERGLDVATTPFTAVGIGDMSGDVFGNGLLRSPHTRLIAAFDHRHIFIDPNPDPQVSYDERRRLYELPRSSWADYDAAKISDGGGVFARSEKSIVITPEVRTALGMSTEPDSVTPAELMRAVLKAPVDLLWNGGIGTYVKATTEQHSDVGDRANDGIRIDATELRCSVVAEGGNLGVTQAARIEFALLGGAVNTDAIDNSAGVDCSDHEVNIKVLLALAENDGDLTRKQRNELLAAMADDVTSAVLNNNDSQNETLSTAVVQAPSRTQSHDRFMTWLEQVAGLDRAVEGLPTTQQLEKRQARGQGLTRPELAVLLAYSKNQIAEELGRGPLPADPRLDVALIEYFPTPLRTQHAALMPRHPLRHELLATIMANELVDRGGITMVHRLIEETSASVTDIAGAHRAAWCIFELEPLWQAARSLDRGIPVAAQVTLLLEVKRLGERATRWILRNEAQPIDLSSTIERFEPIVGSLRASVAATATQPERDAQIEQLVSDGVDRALATQVMSLGSARGLLDLANIADRINATPAASAAAHHQLDDRLELSALRERILSLPSDDHWEGLARGALRDQFFAEHAALTAAVFTTVEPHPSAATGDLVDCWLDANANRVQRYRDVVASIDASGETGLAAAGVAVSALGRLRLDVRSKPTPT